MGTGTSPTVRITLSLALPVLLIAAFTFLRAADPAPAFPEVDAPQFLTWDGDPFDDGLNHYLVALEETTTTDRGWLHRDDAGVLTVDTDSDTGITVSVDELRDVAAGASVTQMEVSDAAEQLSTLPGVSEVRPLGFGFAAVAGDIELDALGAMPGVAAVDRDPSLTAATLDEYYPSQWALDNDGASPETWPLRDGADINAPEGWHRTRGAGVIVAVIDSGVDIAHPDLSANIWRNPGEVCGNGVDDDGNGYIDDCDGWDFASNDAGVEDVNGHGTHVAGIIAAEANNGIGIAGVAYEATVMPLKIGDQTPALSAAIEAFAYAIDNGARVINASWIVEDVNAATYLEPILDAAEAAGVLVVAGAGNSGNNLDSHPVYPASSTNPNVIAVGASTPQDERAPYSGFGPASVDIFAPGEHIASTMPGGSYAVFSGTSMAAPMVSGAAALLWAATPAATAAEVKGALLDRSDGPNDGVASFRSLAVSEGRLNIERSIYTRLFRPSLMFTFHDFNDFEPDTLHTVRVQAQTIDPWIAHPQTPSKYRVGLYVPQDGQPMAVTGYPITYVGGGATTTTLTDATGRAVIGDLFEPQQRPALVQDGDITTLELALPMGTYALVTEIVDVSDPAAPVPQGDPSAVFFFVGPDGSITEMPGAPIGTGDDGAGGDAGGDSTNTTAIDPDGDGTTTTTSGDSGDAGDNAGTGGDSSGDDGTNDDGTDTGDDATDGGSDDDGADTSGDGTTTTAPPGDGDTTTTTTTTLPDGGGANEATTTTTSLPPDDTTTTTTSTTTTVVAPTGIRITDVDPAFGPTAGSTLITITGVDMPEDPIVWFGDRTATVVAVAAPTFIVVETPGHPEGPVDVRVKDRESDDEATYIDGFLYTDEDGGTPSDMTTTTVPGSAPSTTLPDGSPPTTSGGTIPPIEDLDPETNLDEWLGSMLVTPEGLNLAPVPQDHAIASMPVLGWVGVLCDEPVCPGWVIEG